MKHAMGLVALAGFVALSATAQQQPPPQETPKYQSVAPKKKPPQPLDPADVETLTGRPVSPSVTALPRRERPAVDSNGQPLNRRQPLNPVDVDILTGKYDRNRSAGYYRGYSGWEALWVADWMERHDYGRYDDNSFFQFDSRRDRQPFFFSDHGFRGRRFHRQFPRNFFRSGSFFFIFH